jgi:dsRNA-specific ribonuclease
MQVFTVRVLVPQGQQWLQAGIGQGSSKREAKQQAAKQALQEYFKMM